MGGVSTLNFFCFCCGGSPSSEVVSTMVMRSPAKSMQEAKAADVQAAERVMRQKNKRFMT